MRLSYDAEGDVLYISYEPGVAADESDEVEEDVIGRFKDGRIIGYTVLNASLHGVAPQCELRGCGDGLIRMEDTRSCLALGVAMSLNAGIGEMKMGVVRM